MGIILTMFRLSEKGGGRLAGPSSAAAGPSFAAPGPSPATW